MTKHIVFFKSMESDKVVKRDIIDNIANRLRSLKNKIPQIIRLEVGVNINKKDSAYDISLYSIFANIEDLNIYQNHTEHLKVVNEIKAYSLQSAVVDYEFNNKNI